MTGSIRKRSIISNARPHQGREALLTIDLSSCFPSITQTSIYQQFRSTFGCSPPVARLLTRLTTYSSHLPQGAPTSPSLCNIVLLPLSAELYAMSSEKNVIFTQYIDDLTFSGSYSDLSYLQGRINKAIRNAGFIVNHSKTRLVYSSKRMEVTSLVVNKFTSVGRKYIKLVQRDIMKHRLSDPSIKGKISHIRSVSASHAKKLTRKYNKQPPTHQINR